MKSILSQPCLITGAERYRQEKEEKVRENREEKERCRIVREKEGRRH